MGVFDGGQQPNADHDPTQQIQWDIAELARGLGVDITAVIAQLVQAAKEAVEEQIKEIIDTLIGFVTNPVSMLSQLTIWKDKLLGDVSLSTSLSQQAKDAADQFIQFLFRGLGNIPIGSLTNTQPNMVLGEFPNLASIYDNPKWTFDATVSRTADGTGSAKTIANGTQRALRTRLPVMVGAGQKLNISTYVKCTGLVTSGQSFHLDVIRYSGTPKDPVFIATDRLVTLSPGNGAHDWQQMAKEITVPDDGTTCIKIRLVVNQNVTAGSVWYDSVVCKQTSKLSLDWMPEAVEKFLGIFSVFGGAGTLEQMTEAWTNLLKIFKLELPGTILGDLNMSTIWQQIITGRIKPEGLLASLVGGKLPDIEKPQWLTNLTDGIGNLAFGSANTDLGVSNAVESLTSIWGTGKSAQGSADNANIGVQVIRAQLDASGIVGFDELDYASANTLPSDKYALYSEGPGAGNYGPNGQGQLVWKPSGIARRLKLYKHTEKPISTDNGVVTGVWSTGIKAPLLSKGYGYLLGRVSAADTTTHIRAAIDNDTARIQASIGGVVTNIGSSVGITSSDGDVWEFWYGILTNKYKMWLKQNGTTRLVVEDTGHISQLGNLMCGIGGQADNYAVLFQIPPPTWNGWTWKDQNLTAVA